MSLEILCHHCGILPTSEEAKHIKLLQSIEEDDIHLLHYDTQTFDSLSQELKDKLGKIRGTIVSTEKGVLVPSFGYTPTVVIDSLFEDWQTKHFTEPIQSISPMFDGTLLRVWKYKGKIRISSHKKIDSTNSRWGTSKKFVELFLQHIASTFSLEELYRDSSESQSDDSEANIPIHNFLLLDKDLLVASKLSHKDCVIYLNSLNCQLPVSLPTLHYTELSQTSATVFQIKPVETFEEQQTLFPEGLIIKTDNKITKIISKEYQRRCEIVNNDPNILHRAYEMLSEAHLSVSDDDYLQKYPSIPCPTDEQIQQLNPNSDIFKASDSSNLWTSLDLLLSSENKREKFEARFRNAMIHYAKALPLPHQYDALTCIPQVLKERYQAIQYICRNYEKIMSEKFSGSLHPKDQKVYNRLQTIVHTSQKFASERAKSKKDGLSKMITDNIRMMLLNEYGSSMYKIVKTVL